MIVVMLSIIDKILRQQAKYAISQMFRIMNVNFRYADNLDQVGEREVLIFYGSPRQLDAWQGDKRAVISIPDFGYLSSVAGGKGNSLPNHSGSIVHTGRTVPIYYDWIKVNCGRRIAEYLSGDPAVGEQDGIIYFGFDIIMSSFHLLSCQEEYLIKKRDPFGRFLAAYSPRFKSGMLRGCCTSLLVIN